MKSNSGFLRPATPFELAERYQREVEASYDRGERDSLHQAFWGREIKKQFRRVYGWPV